MTGAAIAVEVRQAGKRQFDDDADGATTTAMTTTTTTATMKARHPMMAFVAGFCPGLGLVMTGRFVAGAVLFVVWVLHYFLLPVLVIDHAPDLLPSLPALQRATTAFFWLFSGVVAAGLAFKDGARVRKPYEHWWLLAGWFFFSYLIALQFRTHVVQNQVVFEAVWDTALRPTVPEGTLLIVPKRGFDASQLQINDLVAVPGRGPSFGDKPPLDGYARVIGLAGSVVEVKEDGAVFVDGFPVVTTACAATVPHDGHACAHEKQATKTGAVERDTTATSFARAFTPTSVGPSQVFLLPDDRGHQLVAPAGLVDVKDIAGKVIVTQR